MAPTIYHLQVTRQQISAAQRSGGKITPVDLALLVGTPYVRVKIAGDTIELWNLGGCHTECPLPSDVAGYLARFRRGEPLEPAAFTLDIPPASP